MRALLLVLAASVLVVLAPEANAGGGTAITTCGQVVKTSAFLTHDLACSGRAGMVVGASGITIDLKGFTLQGNRSFGRYGIDDVSGFDGVTVENGVVRDFDYGFVGLGADRLAISGLVVSGNTSGGIFVAGASPQIQSSRASGNGGDGIYVLGATASVESSTASANLGNGIYVSGASSRIWSSTASDNDFDGIIVAGNGARLDYNRADANGLAVSTSDSPRRLGILVFAYTAAPTGTNVARRNSDPAECKPSSLC